MTVALCTLALSAALLPGVMPGVLPAGAAVSPPRPAPI